MLSDCISLLFIFQARRLARKNGAADLPEEGLLEGIPISVKDQFYQKGADSTCGLAVRCFQPATEDGLLVELLVSQGAIPFVRTNVQQSLLLPESDNIVWGTAMNPWDLKRTP